MIHLVRHGETEWSRTRRHTGTTDVALTDHGRAQARALGPVLAHIEAPLVLSSPLQRAVDTATLAGFGPRLALDGAIDDRLVEWNYGEAEGRTTAEIRQQIPDWSVWTHPMAGAESLQSVADRVDGVITERLRPATTDVLVFAHAHLLRILAARWCDLPPLEGQHLQLDPASVSSLGYERSTPCIVRWNGSAPASN